MFNVLRSVFAFFTRLFPREHGKYTILTKLYFKWFAATTPRETIYKTPQEFLIHLDLHEYLQGWIYVFGSYELPTVRFIRRYLTPGMVAIDVGAQIGYITLIMATAANRQVSVLSFEPESNNLKKLQANVELNRLTNVVVIPKAVTDQSGPLRLYLSSDTNAGTHSTVFVEGNVSSSYVEIPSTRLDDIHLARVDLIKIDVEGAEIDVVRGAIETIREHRPVIIAELSDVLQAARDFTCQQFKEFMAELNYNAFTLTDQGHLKESAVDDPHQNDNVVFVPRDRTNVLQLA